MREALRPMTQAEACGYQPASQARQAGDSSHTAHVAAGYRDA